MPKPLSISLSNPVQIADELAKKSPAEQANYIMQRLKLYAEEEETLSKELQKERDLLKSIYSNKTTAEEKQQALASLGLGKAWPKIEEAFAIMDIAEPLKIPDDIDATISLLAMPEQIQSIRVYQNQAIQDAHALPKLGEEFQAKYAATTEKIKEYQESIQVFRSSITDKTITALGNKPFSYDSINPLALIVVLATAMRHGATEMSGANLVPVEQIVFGHEIYAKYRNLSQAISDLKVTPMEIADHIKLTKDNGNKFGHLDLFSLKLLESITNTSTNTSDKDMLAKITTETPAKIAWAKEIGRLPLEQAKLENMLAAARSNPDKAIALKLRETLEHVQLHAKIIGYTELENTLQEKLGSIQVDSSIDEVRELKQLAREMKGLLKSGYAEEVEEEEGLKFNEENEEEYTEYDDDTFEDDDDSNDDADLEAEEDDQDNEYASDTFEDDDDSNDDADLVAKEDDQDNESAGNGGDGDDEEEDDDVFHDAEHDSSEEEEEIVSAIEKGEEEEEEEEIVSAIEKGEEEEEEEQRVSATPERAAPAVAAAEPDHGGNNDGLEAEGAEPAVEGAEAAPPAPAAGVEGSGGAPAEEEVQVSSQEGASRNQSKIPPDQQKAADNLMDLCKSTIRTKTESGVSRLPYTPKSYLIKIGKGQDLINQPYIGGNTLLMFAAQNGHTEIVNLLLAYGANPEVKNNVQQTALELTTNKDIQAALNTAIAAKGAAAGDGDQDKVRALKPLEIERKELFPKPQGLPTIEEGDEGKEGEKRSKEPQKQRKEQKQHQK